MLFGQYGPDLRKRAMGIDKRPIETRHEVKSVSNEVTFARDLTDEVQLLQCFRSLSEQVGRRLRKESLAGTTVQIKLRWSDFTTITRQATLPNPTNLDQEIFTEAVSLFKTNWTSKRPVRLIGVGISNLGPPVHQLHLWGDEHLKEADLLNAVDDLRKRYGKGIIKRAQTLSNRKGGKGPDEDDS